MFVRTDNVDRDQTAQTVRSDVRYTQYDNCGDTFFSKAELSNSNIHVFTVCLKVLFNFFSRLRIKLNYMVNQKQYM